MGRVEWEVRLLVDCLGEISIDPTGDDLYESDVRTISDDGSESIPERLALSKRRPS